MRVRGEGNAGRKGGPPGDLYVFVAVKVSIGPFPNPNTDCPYPD